MAMRTSVVALIILVCFSSSLFHGLSTNPEYYTAAVNAGEVKSANDNKELTSAGKNTDFFFGLPHLWPGVHPPLPANFPKIQWPFVHPPLPANFPKIQWPFVHPPLPSGDFKWPPHFPFVLPPLPAGGFKPPHFPFVLPPLPAGGFKPPHFPFVLPPLPAGGFKPPHFPFVLPPLPAGGFKIPPNWPFIHPPFPGFHWPHGDVESGDQGSVHADVLPRH